jgi:hypothetical protein
LRRRAGGRGIVVKFDDEGRQAFGNWAKYAFGAGKFAWLKRLI